MQFWEDLIFKEILFKSCRPFLMQLDQLASLTHSPKSMCNIYFVVLLLVSIFKPFGLGGALKPGGGIMTYLLKKDKCVCKGAPVFTRVCYMQQACCSGCRNRPFPMQLH